MVPTLPAQYYDIERQAALAKAQKELLKKGGTTTTNSNSHSHSVDGTDAKAHEKVEVAMNGSTGAVELIPLESLHISVDTSIPATIGVNDASFSSPVPTSIIHVHGHSHGQVHSHTTPPAAVAVATEAFNGYSFHQSHHIYNLLCFVMY
jgi:hypothetical protein